MVSHNLRVSGQRIFGTDRVLLASDANQSVELRFDFDCEWMSFKNKAAIFGRVGGESLIFDIIDSAVTVPWEILTKAEPFFLSVMGYDDERLLTTQKSVIPVADSFIPQHLKQYDPSKSIFDRFIDEAEQKYLSRINALEAQVLSKQNQLDAKESELQAANSEIATLTEKNESQLNEIFTLKDECFALYKKSLTVDEWNEFWQGVNKLDGMFASPSFLRETGVKVPPLDTVNVTNASNVLGNDNYGCSVESFSMKCGKVTTLESFAANNTSLRSVTLEEVSTKLKNISKSFYNCSSLVEINGVIDMTNVLLATDAFTGCTSLQNVTFKENTIRASLDFSSCENLTYETLISILNGISDKSAGKTLKLNENSRIPLITEGFTYQSNGVVYEGKEAYYRAVLDKNWVFEGWTL